MAQNGRVEVVRVLVALERSWTRARMMGPRHSPSLWRGGICKSIEQDAGRGGGLHSVLGMIAALPPEVVREYAVPNYG